MKQVIDEELNLIRFETDEGVFYIIPETGLHFEKKIKHATEKEINNKEFKEFISEFNRITKRDFKMNRSVAQQFSARQKEGYTTSFMIDAVKTAMNEAWHIERNYEVITPTFFTRASTLERYTKAQTKKSPTFNDNLL